MRVHVKMEATCFTAAHPRDAHSSSPSPSPFPSLPLACSARSSPHPRSTASLSSSTAPLRCHETSHHVLPPSHRLLKLDHEDDEGDVEYKWRLAHLSSARFQQLVTQMQFRMSEGQGQCLYELGVTDNGTPRGLSRAEMRTSIRQVTHMAQELQLDVHILRYLMVQTSPEVLVCAELLISRRHGLAARDACVAFCGASGSGKSTLVGVILSAGLDDGAGGARQCLFNHKHEVDSGHTSSLATRLWSVPRALPMCGELSAEAEAEAETEAEDAEATEHGRAKCEEEAVSLLLPSQDSGYDANMHHSQNDHTSDGVCHPRDHVARRDDIDEDCVSIDGDHTEDGTHAETECVHTRVNTVRATHVASSPHEDDRPGQLEHIRARTETATMPSLCPDSSGAVVDASMASTSCPLDDVSGKTIASSSLRQGLRCIHLIDLGGDITKHMFSGLLSRRPNYVGVCVSAGGPAEVALLYARVCLTMQLPFFIAVTHCDTVEEFELDEWVMELTAILHGADCRARTVCSVSEAERWAWRWSSATRTSHTRGTTTTTTRRRASDKLDGCAGEENVNVTWGDPRDMPNTPNDTNDAFWQQTSMHTDSRDAEWHSLREVPIFCVSSVQGGQALHALRAFVSNLSVSSSRHALDDHGTRVGKDAILAEGNHEPVMCDGADGIAHSSPGDELHRPAKHAHSRCRARGSFHCFLGPSKRNTPLSQIATRSIADATDDAAAAVQRAQHMPCHLRHAPELPLCPDVVPHTCTSVTATHAAARSAGTLSSSVIPEVVPALPGSALTACDITSSSLFEVFLDGSFTVSNVGHVVHGCVARGEVHVGCFCCVGPDAIGTFHRVCICDIHVDGTHVDCARVGDNATFALDTLHTAVDTTQKGKVLISSHPLPLTCRRLTVRVQIISQSMTENLQPMLFTRNVRQAVRILRPANHSTATACGELAQANGRLPLEPTWTGDAEGSGGGDAKGRLQLNCEFMFRPEIVMIGSPVVLHWSPNGIAIGRVKALLS